MGASPLHDLTVEVLNAIPIPPAICAMSIKEVTAPGIAPRTRHQQPKGKDTLTWVSVTLARVTSTTGRAPLTLNALTTLTITITHGYAVGRGILIQVCGADAQ